MVGSTTLGTQVFGPSTSKSSSDDDRPVWKQPSGKRKPKWLRETLKEAKDFGALKEPLSAIVMPDRLGMASFCDSEPSTFEEASQHHVWRDAMMEEYHSIMTSRWIYKVKHAADGNVEKYKARFVAQRFSQVEGVDYDETFAPVACYTSIISLISIAMKMGWKIHEMDVKTAFLNGIIQEEVYVEQP